MKFTLSDGGWANIRDPRKLTERQIEGLEDVQFDLLQLPVIQAKMAEGGDEAFVKLQDESEAQQLKTIGRDGLTLMRRLRRATVEAYISEWSYADTVTKDTILDSPHHVVNELFEEISKVVTAVGGPHLSVDVDPSPDSPTEHSGD